MCRKTDCIQFPAFFFQNEQRQCLQSLATGLVCLTSYHSLVLSILFPPQWNLSPNSLVGVDKVSHQFRTPTLGWSSASPKQVVIIASHIWQRALLLIQYWIQWVVLQQQLIHILLVNQCNPSPLLPCCCLIAYSLFCVCVFCFACLRGVLCTCLNFISFASRQDLSFVKTVVKCWAFLAGSHIYLLQWQTVLEISRQQRYNIPTARSTVPSSTAQLGYRCNLHTYLHCSSN